MPSRCGARSEGIELATPIPQNQAEFSLEELISATHGTLLRGALLQPVRGVATDTRENLFGKLFVALRGDRFDGHRYLEQAVEKGATAVVISERHYGEGLGDVAVILVDDTLVALGDLAALHRSRWGEKLVAVAGSAGKTTTRSVISKLLEQIRGNAVHSTVGNLNNRIGVPMVVLGLTSEHEFAVVEVGTNQPGEVAALSKIVGPDVAVLTLIDLEHTEGLGDLDGVETEEGAIFQHLSPLGVAVGFGEDPRVLRQLDGSGRRIVSYGFAHARDVRIVEQRLVDDEICEIVLATRGREMRFRSALIGRPGALAVAAGVSAVEALLEQPLSAEICEAALLSAGEPGRNQVFVLSGRRIVVDDTYNSNPASVENSVATGVALAQRSGGRLWLVLGEMLELGSLSEKSHRQMGQLAARSGAHGVFFVQGDARISYEAVVGGPAVCEFFEDAAQVAAALIPRVAEGDVVVVKASRGVRAERVVQGLLAFYKSAPGTGHQTSPRGSGFSS